jgi:hypothetical protein
MNQSQLEQAVGTTRAHLRRILSRATEIIVDEVLNAASLRAIYQDIGDLHPAVCREGHMQSLLFAGLRSSGYFTIAEANYFKPMSNSRQIDLAVWLPDVHRWLYLEIEHCGTQAGYGNAFWDAKQLVEDSPVDRADQLRAVLVYGFRTQVNRRDDFKDKYEELNAELQKQGFELIQIQDRLLEGEGFVYVQAGLWVLGVVGSCAEVPPHTAV